MTILEKLEQEKEQKEILRLAHEKGISVKESEQKYYKEKAFKVVYDTQEFFYLKQISYLDYEEYRLYKIPCQTGQKKICSHVEYEEVDGVQYNKATGEERTEESKSHSEKTSLNRTRQKIYEYAFSNDWTNGLFFTITFNPDMVDSFNYDECYKRVYQFLKNVKDQNQEFKYIFIPEFHKSGRIHFHGIGANCEKLKLEDSGIKKNGKHIYNISSRSFKYGFTTVSKIEDTKKVGGYITKYITKELITNTKGKHRYLCSRNLNKPEMKNVMLEDKETFLHGVEINPKVCHRKKYINEATGQEIEYIKIEK